MRSRGAGRSFSVGIVSELAGHAAIGLVHAGGAPRPKAQSVKQRDNTPSFAGLSLRPTTFRPIIRPRFSTMLPVT